MKKLLLLFILLTSCYTGHQYGVPRNEREARFMEYMDSLIISNNFVFRPHSFRLFPAGRTRRISNLSYGMEYRTNFIRAYIPFYTGVTPPHHVRIMNFTFVAVNDYTVIRDNRNLIVRFSSNVAGTGRNTFTLTISRTSGTATLEVRPTFGPTTTYSGNIFAVF